MFSVRDENINKFYNKNHVEKKILKIHFLNIFFGMFFCTGCTTSPNSTIKIVLKKFEILFFLIVFRNVFNAGWRTSPNSTMKIMLKKNPKKKFIFYIFSECFLCGMKKINKFYNENHVEKIKEKNKERMNRIAKSAGKIEKSTWSTVVKYENGLLPAATRPACWVATIIIAKTTRKCDMNRNFTRLENAQCFFLTHPSTQGPPAVPPAAFPRSPAVPYA